MPSEILVVGVGSHHGDDALGWRVAERVAELAGPSVCVRCAISPAHLLDWLANVTVLHVIDTCLADNRPGRVHRRRWPDLPVEIATPPSSSHDFGLAQVLALAERLGMLPSRTIVWAVEVNRCLTASKAAPWDRVVEDAAQCLAKEVATVVDQSPVGACQPGDRPGRRLSVDGKKRASATPPSRRRPAR